MSRDMAEVSWLVRLRRFPAARKRRPFRQVRSACSRRFMVIIRKPVLADPPDHGPPTVAQHPGMRVHMVTFAEVVEAVAASAATGWVAPAVDARREARDGARVASRGPVGLATRAKEQVTAGCPYCGA
jgi:hypothetical protein